LLEGNHELIRQWRLKEALGRTWSRRPDLLERRQLTDEEDRLLKEYIAAHESQRGEVGSADG
jgi:tRNA (guanine37-N1)-methyltransferase